MGRWSPAGIDVNANLKDTYAPKNDQILLESVQEWTVILPFTLANKENLAHPQTYAKNRAVDSDSDSRIFGRTRTRTRTFCRTPESGLAKKPCYFC